MIQSHLPVVIEARHVRDHVMWLRFADGVEGDVNLATGLRGPIFDDLADPATFARATIEHGTLVWPSGADWAPEDLYQRLRAAKGLTLQPNDDGAGSRIDTVGSMPEISRFFGIVIRMLANDHAPPHFHAQYGDDEITVTIRDGHVTGRFPGRAVRLVLEWRDLHGDELLANWERLREGRSPKPIDPLP